MFPFIILFAVKSWLLAQESQSCSVKVEMGAGSGVQCCLACKLKRNERTMALPILYLLIHLFLVISRDFIHV